MTTDNWYYQRTEFAEKLYDMLVNGPAEAVSIFAPRRSGKTSFLLNDFAKLARKNGHRVIYCDFWQVDDPPLIAVLKLFDQSLKETSLFERLKSVVRNGLNRVSFGIPGWIEIEAGNSRQPAMERVNKLFELDWYCERFAKDDKPAIMLFDEFQELENSDDGKRLIAALRSSINVRSQRILPVFSGSSQEGLRKVFSRRDAPFFRFAYPLGMPPLGESFIRYLVALANKKSNLLLDVKPTVEFFERYEQDPYLFKRWLEAKMREANADSDVLMKREVQTMAADFGLPEQWQDFSSEKKEVMYLLATDAVKIYNEEGKLIIEVIADESVNVSDSLVEGAKHLINDGVLDRWNGHWEIADRLFKLWIRLRPDTNSAS